MSRPHRRSLLAGLAVLLVAAAPAPRTSSVTAAPTVRTGPVVTGPRAVAVGGSAALVASSTTPGGTYAWHVVPARGAMSGGGGAHLVQPRVRVVAVGRRATVHGLAPSASAGDVELVVEQRVGATTLTARVALTVVTGDLTAYRPRHGNGYFPHVRTAVPDDQELDPELGPGVRKDGGSDVDPGAEDDLVELVLASSFAGVPFELVRSSPALRAWTTPGRAAGTEVPFVADRTAPVVLTAGSRTLWIEWSGAHGTATLALVPAGTDGPVDRVRFHTFRSIVMALGGEDQSPSVPLDPNHGTFRVGTELYELGYDVHLYDEDGVAPDGSGKVYDEAVGAVQDRGVVEVVSFGYSHGGGSTWDLVDRLDANRGGIGTFTIPYTAYVDGVENDSNLDTDQENKRPPSSGFHVNHYQVGSFADFFLDGGPVPSSVPAPSGLNVETTPWGAGTTHFEVDDFDEVIDFMRTNLLPRVQR